MTGTTHVERLGAFAANASFDRLSAAAVAALKLRVLDSLGTALGALAAEPVALVRRQVEGNKGFMDAIGGRFELDWEREDLEAVTRTILKRFNGEIHSQSAIEALLELREEHGIRADDVERIELHVFQVAYDIIGGGEEGDKTAVETKEQADHFLPYLLAVALIGGQVIPAQYEAARIVRASVQRLLRLVEVRPDAELSRCFPAEHACRLRIRLHGGRLLERSKRDYERFRTGPMSWETVVAKFERLSAPFADEQLRRRTIDAVARLEQIDIQELSAPLARAGGQSTETAMTR